MRGISKLRQKDLKPATTAAPARLGNSGFTKTSRFTAL